MHIKTVGETSVSKIETVKDGEKRTVTFFCGHCEYPVVTMTFDPKDRLSVFYERCYNYVQTAKNGHDEPILNQDIMLIKETCPRCHFEIIGHIEFSLTKEEWEEFFRRYKKDSRSGIYGELLKIDVVLDGAFVSDEPHDEDVFGDPRDYILQIRCGDCFKKVDIPDVRNGFEALATALDLYLSGTAPKPSLYDFSKDAKCYNCGRKIFAHIRLTPTFPEDHVKFHQVATAWLSRNEPMQPLQPIQPQPKEPDSMTIINHKTGEPMVVHPKGLSHGDVDMRQKSES